jgi:hypothetical protein
MLLPIRLPHFATLIAIRRSPTTGAWRLRARRSPRLSFEQG